MVEFPNGHNFSNLFHMFYGKKIAIGINTMTQPKCFGWWFESIGLKVRNLTLPSSFSSMYKDIHTSYILIHYVRQCVCLSFTYLLLLSIPSPFFFGTLFLLLFHSFSFFLCAASFSLTSFRFHYLSGVIPLAPLLPDFSFTLHFVTHFFPLQSIYFPCLLPIGAYSEYGANWMAPWVFFPPREKGKKRVK